MTGRPGPKTSRERAFLAPLPLCLLFLVIHCVFYANKIIEILSSNNVKYPSPEEFTTLLSLPPAIKNQSNSVTVSNTTVNTPVNTAANTTVAGRISALNRLPAASTKRVAFITFSYVKHDDRSKLLNFLLPAVETWAAPSSDDYDEDDDIDANATQTTLYVVFTNESRGPFEKACIEGEGLSETQRTLCTRIQPIYVNCPEGRSGESPCCKQQKGLLAMVDDRYPLFDWYAFFDDDIYLRKHYVAQILSLFRLPDFPMAAVPRSQNEVGLGQSGYLPSKREMCAQDKNFKYPWGMPIFYSRGAVHMMAKGYRAGSLVKQCAEFEITHDAGNALLNWMYSLPVARLPPSGLLPQIRDDFIGNHWAGRTDREELYHLQPRANHLPPLQPLPKGTFSFRRVHKRWMLPINKAPDPSRLHHWNNLWYHNVTGFRSTETYSKFGHPQTWEEGVWHTMPVSDCKPKGKKIKNK